MMKAAFITYSIYLESNLVQQWSIPLGHTSWLCSCVPVEASGQKMG
jgi:hypothetical protein